MSANVDDNFPTELPFPCGNVQIGSQWPAAHEGDRTPTTLQSELPTSPANDAVTQAGLISAELREFMAEIDDMIDAAAEEHEQGTWCNELREAWRHLREANRLLVSYPIDYRTLADRGERGDMVELEDAAERIGL